VSEKNFKIIGEYFSMLQSKTWLSRALVRWVNTLQKHGKVHETNTFLSVALPNIHRFKTSFAHRLSNKLFLIWLLRTPPYLKHVATLPCNFQHTTGFCVTDRQIHAVGRLLHPISKPWRQLQGHRLYTYIGGSSLLEHNADGTSFRLLSTQWLFLNI